MALINSDLLEPDELNTEDVTVEALGGEVRCRALDMVERLVFERRMVELRKSSSSDDNAWMSMVPEVLETCVHDAKNRPVKSALGWRKWGSKHLTESVQLFNVIWRLSGMSGEDAEKN